MKHEKLLTPTEREGIDFSTGFIPQKGKAASVMDEETGEYLDVMVKTLNMRRRFATVFYVDSEKYEQETWRVSFKELEPPLNPDINTRFKYFDNVVRLALMGSVKALLVTGEGGIGKSWTIEQMLEALELVEDQDYVMVKGNCTPKALFDLISDYSDKLIIFDDCDEVLRHPVSGNLLKATLDAFSKKRVVSWLSSANKTRSARRVDFTGQVIFLSNLNKEGINQALISRCVVIDLKMTQDEKLERMENLLPHIEKDVPLEEKELVLAYLDKYKYTIKDLNIRTLLKAINAYKHRKDLEFMRYQILNG
jgi:hypothetical protein